ncbi:MAG: tRNA-intron lyase [Thermoprotei archaeon]|nr:MAG: tRNA-intron lyase [Thermoprotei archaeon]
MNQEKIAKAALLNGVIIVREKEDVSSLQNKGEYGTLLNDGSLRLFPEEALYLVEKGRIKIYKENKEVSKIELISLFSKRDPLFWIKYTLYYDLRKRGFIVKEGFSSVTIEYRVRKVGENSSFMKYLVIGLREGLKVTFAELENIVTRALRSRKIPIMAIIDKEGNISYYSVSPLT